MAHIIEQRERSYQLHSPVDEGVDRTGVGKIPDERARLPTEEQAQPDQPTPMLADVSVELQAPPEGYRYSDKIIRFSSNLIEDHPLPQPRRILVPLK